jgi:hypothetical protein
MILRKEVDIDRVDDLCIPRRVLFPIAVGLPVRRATPEIVNVRFKPEMQSYVRPAQASPAQIQDDCGLNARLLRDVEYDRNFIRRDRALAHHDNLTIGDAVIVPDGKVKAPEAIT